jgi:hypothetical protein
MHVKVLEQFIDFMFTIPGGPILLALLAILLYMASGYVTAVLPARLILWLFELIQSLPERWRKEQKKKFWLFERKQK